MVTSLGILRDIKEGRGHLTGAGGNFIACTLFIKGIRDLLLAGFPRFLMFDCLSILFSFSFFFFCSWFSCRSFNEDWHFLYFNEFYW